MPDRLFWENGRLACDSPPVHGFRVGDALSVLKEHPANSADVALYSPPYWSQRAYLPDDDPNKGREMGAELSPGEYIDGQVEIVEELRRVLSPWGSIWIVVADTRAGSGGAGGDYNAGGLREGQQRYDGTARKAQRLRDERYRHNSGYANSDHHVRPVTSHRRGEMPYGALDKSLCMIPEILRWTMGYGFNPHTGRTTDKWRVRQVVRWSLPNPPVGRLDDRFRDSIHEIIFAAAERVYWFDLDAVRKPPKPTNWRGTPNGYSPGGQPTKMTTRTFNDKGVPPLDHWVIPTHPYKGSHYAAFSPRIVRPILEAACPSVVCRECGLPAHPGTSRLDTCRHRKWRRGVVIDPFAGTGTTQAVAKELGLSSIGIDLDARNADLARMRVGEDLVIVR